VRQHLTGVPALAPRCKCCTYADMFPQGWNIIAIQWPPRAERGGERIRWHRISNAHSRAGGGFVIKEERDQLGRARSVPGI
jgi:hypothetical protein